MSSSRTDPHADPAPIRAVVFDLDGLMFDTEALFGKVAHDFLAARGKAFTPEIMRSIIGRRAVEGMAIFRAMSGLDEPVEAIQAELKRRFYAEVDTAVHPTPGLFALLDALGDRGLPHAVATSSGRDYAVGLLTRHGLIGRFAFVLTSEDVSRGKPDPEIYLKAAARFGLEPSALMVLEDSPPGIAAARAAGAFAVGIPHDHSPPDGLGAASLVVPRLDDPAVLARLGPVPASAPAQGPK